MGLLSTESTAYGLHLDSTWIPPNGTTSFQIAMMIFSNSSYEIEPEPSSSASRSIFASVPTDGGSLPTPLKIATSSSASSCPLPFVSSSSNLVLRAPRLRRGGRGQTHAAASVNFETDQDARGDQCAWLRSEIAPRLRTLPCLPPPQAPSGYRATAGQTAASSCSRSPQTDTRHVKIAS